METLKKARIAFSLFIIFQLICSCLGSVSFAASAFTIGSEADYLSFAASVNAGNTVAAVLTNDIVLGDNVTVISPDPGKAFNGVLIGNGHVITLTSPVNNTYQGNVFSSLFGYIGANGRIANLTLNGSVQTAGSAALLAYSNSGTVQGVTNNAAVTAGRFVSAFTYINNGTVSQCANNGKLTTQYGEIFGFAFENPGTIENSQNNGRISGGEFAAQEMFAVAAGAFAKTNSGYIGECLNSADVEGGQNVSAFAAANSGTVVGCVNAGDITAYSQYASGAVNSNTGSVLNCENSGNVSTNANYSAGIANTSSGSGKISGCLNFGNITGDSQVAGIVSETSNLTECCNNYGDIINLSADSSNTRKKYYAGIAGMSTANITACVNRGVINGGVIYTGGIVGFANGNMTVSSCANLGVINGFAHRVGGIAGHANSGVTIRECASYGNVNGAVSGVGNFSGALAGYSAAIITDCIAEASVTGVSTSGGFIARNYSTASPAITNCVMTGSPCRLTAANNGAGFSDIYVTQSCNGGTLMSAEDFGNGVVAALLNTLGNTVESRDIFDLSGGKLIIKSIPAAADEKTVMTKPDDSDPTVGVNILIPAELNNGLAYDIYAVFLSPDAYIFLPGSFTGSEVVYRVINENGAVLETQTAPISENTSETVTLKSGTYSVKVIKSTLPVFYMNIDEQYGSVARMNTSDKHVDYCYGDFSLDVPDSLALSKGWDSHYESIDSASAATPGSMSVRGRGNSSWKIQTNKKPSYQVKSEKKVNLLKMGSSKKWVLVAGDNDLFKNKFGLDLGKELGIAYTNESEFVDLYVNGAYMGVYMLSEKVEIGSTRIAITDMDDAIEESGVENVDMTGGYLVEIDNAAEANESFTIQGNAVSVKSPETLDTAVSASNRYSYIVDLISDMFNTVYESETLTMSDGTPLFDRIDVESFVRYFWHQEFIGNTDCGRGSTYFYKDTDSVDPRIYAGPIWDSDALSYYYRTYSWWMPQSTYSASNPNSAPSFYRRLIDHKEFMSYALAYYDRYHLGEALAKAPLLIASYEEQLQVPGRMNSIRWNNGAAFDISNYRTTAANRCAWVEQNKEGLAELATMGSFIDIEDEPASESIVMARMEKSGGTANSEIGTPAGGKYFEFRGFKGSGTSLGGSVNGTSLCPVVYSDSAYAGQNTPASVPVIAASAENTWGSVPYFEISTNSLNFGNISFSAKLGGSKKGPKNFRLLYSTNGVDFTPLATYSIQANKKTEQAFDNVILPQDADNSALLIFRIENTDRVTISGGSLDSGLSSGESAINDIVISGIPQGEIEVLPPIADKQSGTIVSEQAITLSTDTPDSIVYYTLTDGVSTTEAAEYASPILPFDVMNAEAVTLCAWTSAFGKESEKVYYTYLNGGMTVAAFSNGDWTSASTGKIYATGGIYKNAFLYASLDGTNVYPPLKADKGFALSPDDGEKWHENGGWYFEIPTAGFSDIRMTMDAASTSKGPASMSLSYSINGVDYTELEANRAFPLSTPASYYSFYEFPAIASDRETLYVKLTMREDLQASGAPKLFNNLSKGNNYIDNIIFTGTKESALMPYAEKTSDSYDADEFITIISPEQLPVTYSVSANGETLVSGAAYTAPIDMSAYAAAGSDVTLYAQCPNSKTFTETYRFAGNVFSGFEFKNADNISANSASATTGYGEIISRPNGTDAAALTYDKKYGLQAQANQSLYWIYPDADWLIHFSARRYEKLTLSVDQRSGGSGPRDFKLQYSLNGVDFTDIPSSRVRVTGALKPTYTNFALPDELSGEKSVYIRIKICGNENVEGKELDDPTVIGSGKTSVNNIIIKGIKLPSMLSNVEENDSAVSAVLTNLTQAAITPVAVLTRYQAGMAVKTDILNINTLAPGEYAELNFSAYADDYNKMKIMVFDSLGSMKPLCDAYELGGVKNPSLLSYVSYSEGASAVLTNNTGSPITPVVILSRYKDGLLVKASVEQIEVLNEGDQVIIRFPDCEEEYDDVKMLVFNGFDSMQPLN